MRRVTSGLGCRPVHLGVILATKPYHYNTQGSQIQIPRAATGGNEVPVEMTELKRVAFF